MLNSLLATLDFCWGNLNLTIITAFSGGWGQVYGSREGFQDPNKPIKLFCKDLSGGLPEVKPTGSFGVCDLVAFENHITATSSFTRAAIAALSVYIEFDSIVRNHLVRTMQCDGLSIHF